MKRGELKRGKPLARGTATLSRTPMPRGDSVLKSKAPMQRASKPIRAKSRTNADPRPKTGHAELCRGRSCYLAIPGLCRNDVETVVPAHSNQQKHGKGRGIKAHDFYTVPACHACHAELDQGMRYTKAEKFALWDQAFERWRHVRDVLQSALGKGNMAPL